MSFAKAPLKIVVAADGGAHSKRAFRRALDAFWTPAAGDESSSAQKDDAVHFYIVHVRHAHREAEGLYPYKVEGSSELTEREAAHALLDEFRKVAVDAGIADWQITTEDLHGDPRERLCEYCASVGASILFMGTRGLTKVKRMFMGSVTSYCVTHAPCAIWIDREKKSEQSVGEA